MSNPAEPNNPLVIHVGLYILFLVVSTDGLTGTPFFSAMKQVARSAAIIRGAELMARGGPSDRLARDP